MLQIISTIVFYIWMFLLLGLLWAIWRNSVITTRAWETLINVAVKSAEAAQESAKAASALAKEKPVL